MSDDKKGKPTYQAPVVMPLGELAKGEGQTCRNGSTASSCRDGAHASNLCSQGAAAVQNCNNGGTARCKAGVFPFF